MKPISGTANCTEWTAEKRDGAWFQLTKAGKLPNVHLVMKVNLTKVPLKKHTNCLKSTAKVENCPLHPIFIAASESDPPIPLPSPPFPIFQVNFGANLISDGSAVVLGQQGPQAIAHGNCAAHCFQFSVPLGPLFCHYYAAMKLPRC